MNREHNTNNTGILFIQKLLELQIQMKIHHWQTTNYARHKASDHFMDDMDKLIDRFIECFQGKYGRIRFERGERETSTIVLKNIGDNGAIDKLKKTREFLSIDCEELLEERHRQSNFDLLAIRDEMLELINKYIYLFTLQ